MFPGLSDMEIAEKAAAFFNAISQEHTGLTKPQPTPGSGDVSPEMYQIAAKLKNMKKPRSTVAGDIDARLVTAFADILAIPLSFIYRQVHESLEWPIMWASETVTLIPKVSTPSSLAQLRNLSCTPLFSKCLESFVLERLKQKVTLNRNQFGGIKGTGVDHFLVETWHEIMKALEDPSAAASLMSIDFEKAFNRMSHGHCLEALERIGADQKDIGLVHAFLHGRTMRVKVGNSLSAPRTVPGGSPQGSILGNFLFCVSTSELAECHSSTNADVWPQSEYHDSTVSFDANGVSGSDMSGDASGQEDPISRPQRFLSDSSSNDSFDFQYFNKRKNVLDDTVLSERCTQDEIDLAVGLPAGWTDQPLSTKVYIDDLNNIEKVKQSTAVCTLSEAQTTILPHAIQSEKNFNTIKKKAENIGMRVNEQKTQLLCISGTNYSDVKSYIRTESGQEIKSSDELKILGFWFGNEPTVAVHVRKLSEKFRARLWSLRHLKRSGMSPNGLLFVYLSVLRPVLDFAAPTYHSIFYLLPRPSALNHYKERH